MIPPGVVWIPLSKGPHREPHGRLISPAKYQYTNQIYDIGTEILCKTCFGHNSTQKASPEELQVRIFTNFSVDSESAIKIRISKEYKLADAKQAHEDLESRKLTGPAVIIP